MNPIFKTTGMTFFHYLVIFTVVMFATIMAGCQTTPPPKPYSAPKDAVYESGRPYVFFSAARMAEAIRKGEISSEELVKMHLKHIYMHNPDLNAIVIIDEEAALKRAAEADKALSRGENWGPLHGVPVTIKDQFAVKNMRTTNASEDFSEQVTLFDATVVKRMKEAGAVILGKTNMPFFAMDFQTANTIFGRTSNPWDLDRTSGGSTGGAAAVAAGMTPIDIGSDISGSLRIPAHFTGTYSLKPTENTVSGYGSFPGILSLDNRSVRHMASIGPVARSVKDLKLALEIISGPDDKDALVTPLKQASDTKKTMDSLRIAWSDNLGNIPVTKETRNTIHSFIEKLSDAGSTTVKTVPGIDFTEALKTSGEIIDIQIMSAHFGHMRFFTFLFGWSYRAQSPLLQMVYPLSVSKQVDVLSRKDRFVSKFDQFMSTWDVFICPAASLPAIEHYPPDAIRSKKPIYNRPVMVDSQEVNYWTAMGAYAAPFNLTGHPVVTIPAGFTENGLPIGVQIVGKRWQDFELLEIVQLIDEVAGNYREPGGY